jgi:pimeloyl-ACP methyl ester carboxylesterase
MAVEIDGEGDAVLLIHGLGGSSNVWTPVMPALARHRAIRPDLPGSARSARVEGPLSIGRFVEAMQRICSAVGVERVHVAAHSLGTIVAFHLAAAATGLVRSLALFGPLLAPADAIRSGIRARGEKARTEGEAGMQEIANALVQAATSPETKARRPVTAALVREFLMRQPPEGYARTCDALADAQAADVSRLACPVLLVTGDEDAVAPAQAVRQIAERIPGCRLEILRGCGHWTTIEKPDECTDLLRRFLEANRR